MVEPKPTHRTMGIIQNADLCKQLSGWRVLFCRISPQTRLIDGYSWFWCFGVNTEASLLPLALGPDLLSKKTEHFLPACGTVGSALSLLPGRGLLLRLEQKVNKR